jgi:uncharacterized protein YdeI (YjbR/CyaY-like superfamily)
MSRGEAPGKPRAFASARAFGLWLEKHHDRKRELLLRCYKEHARHRGMTYLEALDEALCHGWIDGVRRSVDEESFSVRFSPRRAGSKWSRVNTRRARRLQAAGRLRPAGLAAFEARDPRDARLYSFESRPTALTRAFATRLRANRRAWAFFQAQPPWYRRSSAFWVMSAKREETRERRFAVLSASSARGTAIPPLARAPGRPPTKRS